MSCREYHIRLAWLDLQQENPNRTDWYLMQLTGYVDKVLAKSKSFEPSSYKLSFTTEKSSPNLTVEQRSAQTRSQWRQRMGKQWA